MVTKLNNSQKGDRRKITSRGIGRCWRCMVTLLILMASSVAHAEFNLNFMPDDGAYINNDAYVSCNMSYLSDANCNPGGGMRGDYNLAGSHDDGSAFYQRMFDDVDGNRYYQVIVGDYLVDDFVQEYIIKADATTDGNWYTGGRGNIARSASAGNSADRLYNMTEPYDVDGSLSSDTGTGSGNPTRVIMRQILTDDSQTSMEFLKDQFANKPLISQTTQDSEFISYIELDMRNKTYLDDTPIDPATKVINTAKLLGTNEPNGTGNYDYATQADTAYVTAGAYTYTSGTNYGESLGTYTYMDVGTASEYQPTDVDYSIYCDVFQNTDWSGNGACTNGDGTGGGFRGGRMMRR